MHSNDHETSDLNPWSHWNATTAAVLPAGCDVEPSAAAAATTTEAETKAAALLRPIPVVSWDKRERTANHVALPARSSLLPECAHLVHCPSPTLAPRMLDM